MVLANNSSSSNSNNNNNNSSSKRHPRVSTKAAWHDLLSQHLATSRCLQEGRDRNNVLSWCARLLVGPASSWSRW